MFKIFIEKITKDFEEDRTRRGEQREKKNDQKRSKVS